MARQVPIGVLVSGSGTNLQAIIDPAAIVPGDVLIGLPSSGLHSNGYSLARKILLEVGRMRLSRHVPELGRTLGEELLKPTRIYARIMRTLFHKHKIKGTAHITGGGIVGNLPRVLPIGRQAWIERGSWPVAPIFNLIQEAGNVAQAEMDRTFNNGLGMILVVGKKDANGVLRTLKRLKEMCFVVGEIRKGTRGTSLT